MRGAAPREPLISPSALTGEPITRGNTPPPAAVIETQVLLPLASQQRRLNRWCPGRKRRQLRLGCAPRSIQMRQNPRNDLGLFDARLSRCAQLIATWLGQDNRS